MAGPDWTRVSGSDVLRPFGYRHEEPIARQIGSRDLFLGNLFAADPSRCHRSFDRVVSLTREPAPATTHHCPMVDGPENDWTAFERAADAARCLVGEGDLLVHCSHGISRSAIVTAVVVALTEDRSLVDALAVVQAVRPPAVPHPALHAQGVTYVAAKR